MPRTLSKRQWVTGIIFICAYFATSVLGARAFTAPAVVSAASGVALAGLFLLGARLWPVLYVSALTSYLFNHAGNLQLFVLLILPIAQTCQAALGVFILKNLKFDPALSHLRDAFAILIVGVTTSIITPAMGLFAYALNQYFFGTIAPAVTLGSWWAGTTTSIIIVAPFIIRWLNHSLFYRTTKEVIEIVAALATLLAISVFLFLTLFNQIAGISLVYLLLVPLFWIALRIGPRFMTLAITMISTIGITSIFWGPLKLTPILMGQRLFQMEIFLIIIASIFLILAGSEEERKEALQKVRSQVVQLENDFGALTFQDRRKSEFLATLAHELRNPLAPMVSSLELLRIEEKFSPEGLLILDEMDDRIKTIRRLLDDILDISRLSQDKLRLKKEYLDLRKIVLSATRSVENVLRERKQFLSVDIDDEPIFLTIDAVRIEQIVTNLLTNASKFTPQEGRISISLRKKENVAEIRVKDSGIGIDPEMLGKIFEPFLQIENGRANDGLGIGLSLTKQLIEMHDGTIEARSKGRGQGTEFIARLPLLTFSGENEESSPEEKPSVQPSSQKAKRSRRVLVVDDNFAAARGMGKLLEHMGHLVYYAYTGAEAVQQAITNRPDTIILDIGLPDMSGYETAALLRNENGFSGMLIALTGYGQDEDKEKAFASGFSHHLTKPIGIADLQIILDTNNSIL